VGAAEAIEENSARGVPDAVRTVPEFERSEKAVVANVPDVEVMLAPLSGTLPNTSGRLRNTSDSPIGGQV